MVSDIDRALNLVKENRVVKIRFHESHYLVRGKTSEYLVVNRNFCTCEHFLTRCLQQPGIICYHILATTLVDEESLKQVVKSDDEIYAYLTSPPKRENL